MYEREIEVEIDADRVLMLKALEVIDVFVTELVLIETVDLEADISVPKELSDAPEVEELIWSVIYEEVPELLVFWTSRAPLTPL